MKRPQLLASVLLIAILLPGLSACTSSPATKTADFARVSREPDRLLIRTGEIVLAVSDPAETISEVETIVADSKGYVEQSTTEEMNVWLTSRIPAASLDEVMDEISELGRVVRRSASATDVTDHRTDLAARLANSRELRNRMRSLLDRADTVQDLVAIEKELARLQSEIETMEAQISRLDSQIDLSSLSIQIQQERVLGPVGLIGYWSWWAISKLFVIR